MFNDNDPQPRSHVGIVSNICFYNSNTLEKDLVKKFYPDVEAYAFTIHPDAMEKLGGPRRQDLKQDLFAEKIKQLEGDISTDNYTYQVGCEEFSLQSKCVYIYRILKDLSYMLYLYSSDIFISHNMSLRDRNQNS